MKVISLRRLALLRISVSSRKQLDLNEEPGMFFPRPDPDDENLSECSKELK